MLSRNELCALKLIILYLIPCHLRALSLHIYPCLTNFFSHIALKMVKHNNEIPHAHFHKDWDKRVRMWFNQPIRKKIRRDLRKEKAAKMAPAPTSGALRPVVMCPTRKYNTKSKLGRGFTLEELKGANISPKTAATIGIAVDHRRTNKSEESYNKNVERLTAYKARLVVFPRRSGKKAASKKDVDAKDSSSVAQLTDDLNKLPKTDDAITYGVVTDAMKANKAYEALREARNEAKLFGRRIAKKIAAEKED